MTDFEKRFLDVVNLLRKQIGRIETREQPAGCRWRGSSATAPSAAAEGDVWNDTSGGNVVKIYAAGDWRALN